MQFAALATESRTSLNKFADSFIAREASDESYDRGVFGNTELPAHLRNDIPVCGWTESIHIHSVATVQDADLFSRGDLIGCDIFGEAWAYTYNSMSTEA
jgi:hypothetical protein